MFNLLCSHTFLYVIFSLDKKKAINDEKKLKGNLFVLQRVLFENIYANNCLENA